MKRRLFLYVLSCMAIASAHAESPLRESFDLSVPMAPTRVAIEGQTRLFYELHLANFSRRPLDPVRVAVFDAASGAALATFEGEALERRFDRSGLQWQAKAGAPIEPGRRGIVFFELALPAGTPAPGALLHRVHYRVTEGEGETARVDGARVPVAHEAAMVIGPPLRGGPWIAIHDPSWERGHRRVVYAIDGKARTPGRFAVDWVKLDAQGRKSRRDRGLTADAYSHGEDVLAVADATVVSVRDDLSERRRLDERSDHTLDTGSGNAIALDLGGGRYAFYGHLRPGSARVAPGDRVRKGQKIAEVGFTGSASDPQLHFNLADQPAAVGSEGLPFALDRFRSLGTYARIDDVGTTPWMPRDGGEEDRVRELPAGNSVVMFED
ncbi:M23 family metallopeptidase [Pseudoxanthomonas sp. PXM02]|uniref:M23 family metallopeptidase n=1 Tax=Pseudoxanthomonas sp. PXM02 TaxID=2769294 RepID=UPI00177FEC52|nr:M23 family metallopeptidase [Pseudoxanthomonas sp. PXM02]MBD9478840.1 M23 family metallopeptidase [Pseudoxanthomonas sp. PXM02]